MRLARTALIGAVLGVMLVTSVAPVTKVAGTGLVIEVTRQTTNGTIAIDVDYDVEP